MRDAGNVKNRILVFERIKTGMVAERALGAQLIEFDVTFQHDFR